MREYLRVILVATVILAIPGDALAAEEVTVLEILERAGELTGAEVTVQGELVGDYGFRADGSMWTQLNGDPYVQQPIREGGPPLGGNLGIGVRMPAELAEGLDPPGGYRHRGPIVSLTGIWKYHDPERQGESYLEVESLRLVEPGRSFDEDLDWPAVIFGALFLGGAGAVVWLTRRGQ